MPVDIPRLRYWFAVAAVAITVMVAGIYFWGRSHWGKNISAPPQKLGGNVQQSTQGFSLSKSEGGHTLFTVRAAKATQYREGGHAELNDVTIVVYGHESNRYDQIYGSDFEYDPQTGNVIAKGVVNIDLEADSDGTVHPDQAPPQELKNPIHLTTSGLVFNQKTGAAKTTERIEFRIPEASGWADGALYDSKNNELVLDRNVHIATAGPNPANIVGRHGTISKTPRRAVLEGARIQNAQSTIETQELTVYLREDNSVDHMVGRYHVQATTRGETSVTAQASEAVLQMEGKGNELRQATLTGGVTYQAAGANQMAGSSDQVMMEFHGRNLLGKVRAQGNARIVEPPKSGAENPQQVELAADTIDFLVNQGKRLNRAETGGSARIILTPVEASAGNSPAGARPDKGTAGPTVITAGRFYADFDGQSRLKTLNGYPDAKVASFAAGAAPSGTPERISTSGRIEVAFAPGGGVGSVVQRENFEYHERLPNGTDRNAWAQAASYSAQADTLVLTGAPRIVEGGMTATARVIRLDRKTGDANAEGEVKTTYSELKPQPGGALLAASEPVHVTARSMTAQRATGVAHYAGGARMWQGANIIEGATIDFNREQRTVVAKGGPAAARRVLTVLTQQGKDGKQTPVNVSSASLTYSEVQRVAHFEGGVVIRGADGVVTANKADVYLQSTTANPATAQRPAQARAPAPQGQVDHVVAEGNVHVQQPTRIARGEKLVYTGAEEKFVLTGGGPSVTDAEHGTIRGTSLTFYSRNDKVLVEGGEAGRTVTETRVSK